jgi:hypothetical protein
LSAQSCYRRWSLSQAWETSRWSAKTKQQSLPTVHSKVVMVDYFTSKIATNLHLQDCTLWAVLQLTMVDVCIVQALRFSQTTSCLHRVLRKWEEGYISALKVPLRYSMERFTSVWPVRWVKRLYASFCCVKVSCSLIHIILQYGGGFYQYDDTSTFIYDTGFSACQAGVSTMVV